jgi:hypothetical protein
MVRANAAKLWLVAVLGVLAAATGILALPNDWSFIPTSYCLVWSQIALVWLAWRARPVARRLLILLLSTVCVWGHVVVVPWDFITKLMFNGLNPPVRTALLASVMYGLWALPVFGGFLLAMLVRSVSTARQPTPSVPDWLEAARTMTRWSSIAAAMPAFLLCVALVSHKSYVGIREQVAVARHPEARVVREYLDALALGNYTGMARRLAVTRTTSRADGWQTKAVEYPPLEDFDGRPDLLESFVTYSIRRQHKFLHAYYDVRTVYVAEARQMCRARWNDSGEMLLDPIDGYREVVVWAWMSDQRWVVRYFAVNTRDYLTPRIKTSRYLPHWIPEGQNPIPQLATAISYDLDYLQTWLSKHR